jgi:hypothetical protein
MAPRRQKREIGAAESESDHSFRYGGPWFAAASALPLDRGLIRSGRLATLVAIAVRRPARVAALFVILLRTRSEHIFLSESRAGQALTAYFNQRSLGVFPTTRLCRGVLLLPREHSDYLRGRRRQALRTNLRRAATAGIRCELASDRSAVVDELFEIRRRANSFRDVESDTWRATLARPEITIMMARDECGRPLAMTGVIVDDSVCLISFAVATSHEARWALHDHLVRTLITRRVRYLLAEDGGPFGALGFTVNVQHYQHLLGYELRHLTPVSPHVVMRRRRLLVSLAVAGATIASLGAPPGAV